MRCIDSILGNNILHTINENTETHSFGLFWFTSSNNLQFSAFCKISDYFGRFFSSFQSFGLKLIDYGRLIAYLLTSKPRIESNPSRRVCKTSIAATDRIVSTRYL
jgi:hypothetical protein